MILAPMAGVTDAAFRHVCIDFGCEKAFCEMVSVNALKFDSKRTYELMDMAENEKGLNVQIFGGDPQLMADIAKKLHDIYQDKLLVVDINMGCPMPKIVKCGYGSALLNDPLRASEIIKAVKKVSTVPVTVKIRKGFDDTNVNAVEFSKMIEDSGADTVTVHGRTARQLYSGTVDLDIIKQVKENVNIPVIGNGDIFSYKDAVYMKEYTGCDDVLVARGAMGNPFIFAKRDDVGIDERIETALKHLDLAAKYKDEKIAILEMRKHIAWYISKEKGSAKVRTLINTSKSKAEIYDILQEYRKQVVDNI